MLLFYCTDQPIQNMDRKTPILAELSAEQGKGYLKAYSFMPDESAGEKSHSCSGITLVFLIHL